MPNYTNSTGTCFDWQTYSGGHQFSRQAKEEFLKKRAFGSMGTFGMSNVSSTTFSASTADVAAISNMKANAAEKLKEKQQCHEAIKIALDQSKTKRNEQGQHDTLLWKVEVATGHFQFVETIINLFKSRMPFLPVKALVHLESNNSCVQLGDCVACGMSIMQTIVINVYMLRCQHPYHPLCFVTACKSVGQCLFHGCDEPLKDALKLLAPREANMDEHVGTEKDPIKGIFRSLVDGIAHSHAGSSCKPNIDSMCGGCGDKNASQKQAGEDTPDQQKVKKRAKKRADVVEAHGDASKESAKVYVVYMGSIVAEGSTFELALNSHVNLLANSLSKRKLIGAKYFKVGIEQYGPLDNTTDYISTRDNNGHGSHTASTILGSVVEGASLYGLAKGTARGAVPSARLAAYKVCWSFGCEDVDILAAFDEALHDGVDLLSLSLGSFFPMPYEVDSIAIGAFHAMQRGIVVSCAAGNAGNDMWAINVAPWIITVAASSIDRQFYSPLTLGNNVTIKGTAVNTFASEDKWYPLIPGVEGAFENSTDDLNFCDSQVLDPEKVKGKIVFCEEGGFGGADESVVEAGGKGLVYTSEENSVGFAFLLSTSLVNFAEGEEVYKYINKTSEPVAKIMPCEVSTKEEAPMLAFFSSRGPNIFTPSIMKPDIAAPGVDILAAWSKNDSITEYPESLDSRRPDYNIISGTSMATPHVTGAAAYVKSIQPHWGPSFIKSALMTTGMFQVKHMYIQSHENRDLELGYGAGQINPTKAIDPGLVYDASYLDYVAFLCTHGYNSTTIALITGETNTKCPQDIGDTPAILNYPAIFGAFTLDLKGDWYTTSRTLTNVGNPSNLTYTAKIEIPTGMEVTVEPMALSFTSLNEAQSYNISVRALGLGVGETRILSTSLTWYNEVYSVRTPIVAYLVSF
ncbi:hypothetical protein L7F22_006141 [Adiantum nelumboides]|nr:hypothetical protein [Adiantum nelumboides]